MAVGKNNGDRALPVITIYDTDFFVDIKNLEFIQVENHANKISFRDVRDFNQYTEITYDTLTKNAFKGSEDERRLRKDVVDVKLPSAINLDTQGLADEIVINVRKQHEVKTENSPLSKSAELKMSKRKRNNRRL